MCGLAGIFNADGAPVNAEALRAMIGRIRHRGPDEWGTVCEGHVGLAHARLSIIDAAGGTQPMRSADGRFTIAFNGEIFNYVELRADLQQQGVPFRTHSDTEVLLQLFAAHGERCVELLNGQWAFAIWDAETRRVFASRDRLGVRPFFYTTTAGGGLAFASEIKALLAHPGVERRLDLRALDQTFTFWAPLSPRTIFRDILELPPGHSVWFSAGDMPPRPRAYWSLAYPEGAESVREEDYADELVALLSDATRIRLRADVPVGAYVSGGLDSAIIAALVRRTSAAPLRTFSIAFDDPAYDESAFQQQVIAGLGTAHDRLQIGPRDVAEAFADVVTHAEQPLLRTAPAPMYLLARRVRAHGYKVVLTGEGADEMFGGYDIFKEAKIRRFWAQDPGSSRRASLLRRLYPYMNGMRGQSDAYLRGFFHADGGAVAHPFFSHLPRWTLTARLKAFFSPDVQAELAGYDPLADLSAQLPPGFAGWDYFARSQYLETTHLLPRYILSAQGDRMAMAHGVEARYPFLDHRVVAFAARLPARLKMRALQEKYLLRRATRQLVPAAVRARRKQPYRAPDAPSFFPRGAAAAGYVDELLSPDRVREFGVFNVEAVGRLVRKARAGRVDGVRDNMAVVGVLSTQLLIDRLIRIR